MLDTFPGMHSAACEDFSGTMGSSCTHKLESSLNWADYSQTFRPGIFSIELTQSSFFHTLLSFWISWFPLGWKLHRRPGMFLFENNNGWTGFHRLFWRWCCCVCWSDHCSIGDSWRARGLWAQSFYQLGVGIWNRCSVIPAFSLIGQVLEFDMSSSLLAGSLLRSLEVMLVIPSLYVS